MSQQINLYNPIFLKKEKHFSARTMLQALGLIAIGITALCAYAVVESRAAERTARHYNDQLAAQRAQMVQLVAQLAGQGRNKALEAEIARLQREVATRESTLGALGRGELGNTAGFSDFFAAFGRRAIAGVWLTAVTVGDSGNELFVQGRALKPELVPAYLSSLSKEGMMQGRRVIELRLAARGGSPAAKGAAATPERFVEFTFTAPMRLPEPPAEKATP